MNSAVAEQKYKPEFGVNHNVFEFSLHPRDTLRLSFTLPCSQDITFETFDSFQEHEFFEVKTKTKIILAKTEVGCVHPEEKKWFKYEYEISDAAEKIKLIAPIDVLVETRFDCEPYKNLIFDDRCNVKSIKQINKTPHPGLLVLKRPLLPECDTLGNWEARVDNFLFDNVNGNKTKTLIKKGDIVKTIKGETHSHPMEVEVFYDHKHVKRGQTVYWVDFSTFWQDGLFLNLDPLYLLNPGSEKCKPSSNLCWGRLKEKYKSPDLWIYIETPDGKKGWIKETSSDNYIHSHQC